MSDTVDQALRQAITAHSEGKLQEAERLYRTILQFQPTHADANHNLGALMVAIRRAEAALPFFFTALQANPNVEQFWLSYIACHIKVGDLDEAKRSISEAKQTGISQASLSQLEQELELSARDNRFPERTGLSLKEKRRKQASKKRKKKKGGPDITGPTQQQLHGLLASYQAGHLREATELARALTQSFPAHPFAWQIIGLILHQSGKPADALPFLRQSAALSTRDAPAQINLGNVLSSLGQFEEAAETYAQAIKFDRDSAEAHGNLGSALSELGRLEEAEASLGRAILFKPDHPEFRSNLGSILNKLGRFAEAEASCRQAIDQNPTLAGAHVNLGAALQALNRLEKAESSYSEAVRLNPNLPEAHNGLGSVYYKLDRVSEAMVSHMRALELQPDFAEAHLNLGIVHYAAGDFDSSLMSLKKAGDLEPDSKVIRLLTAVLNTRHSCTNDQRFSVGKTRIRSQKLPATRMLRLFRPVEVGLASELREARLMDLDKENEVSFGNIRGSDYDFFQDERPAFKPIATDLKQMLMAAFDSEVFLYESFVSIFNAGSGTAKHNHLTDFDRDKALNLAAQKYALVYYLSVGDQQCSEPGLLKLYEPQEEILPDEGSIIILPADRYHSSAYGGVSDRIILGVNFYTLDNIRPSRVG